MRIVCFEWSDLPNGGRVGVVHFRDEGEDSLLEVEVVSESVGEYIEVHREFPTNYSLDRYTKNMTSSPEWFSTDDNVFAEVVAKANANFSPAYDGSSDLCGLLFASYCLQRRLYHTKGTPDNFAWKDGIVPDELPLLFSSFDRESGKLSSAIAKLGDEGAAHFRSYENGAKMAVRIASDSLDRTSKLVTEFTDRYLKPAVVEEAGRVPVGFWFSTAQGPTRYERSVDTPKWSDIACNYSANAQKEFQTLASIKGLGEDSGRIILLHGVTGSGKSTALRALASEWREWANFDVVVDPEVMLGSASYLLQVVSASHRGKWDDEEDDNKWNVLLLEDSGELTRADAKDRTGQGLSRLLNMADGILGRGMRTLFVITTNERLGDLHQAIVRPGRCLAEFEVPKLSVEEASQWLGVSVKEPTTLAELYAKKHADPLLNGRRKELVEVGQYL